MAGANEVRAFQVMCPAGTPMDTPIITDLDLPVRTVLHIRVRIPSGPSGTMGFAIGSNGVPIFPYASNVYAVADDETFDWDVENQINSGSWQAIMYNTGHYNHTIYIYFTVRLPDAPPVRTPLAALPRAALGSG